MPSDFVVTRVRSPICGRATVMDVPEVHARAVLDQHSHDVEMPRECGLMERRGMRVKSQRVVAIGILSRFQQQFQNSGMTVLTRDTMRRKSSNRRLSLGR